MKNLIEFARIIEKVKLKTTDFLVTDDGHKKTKSDQFFERILSGDFKTTSSSCNCLQSDFNVLGGLLSVPPYQFLADRLPKTNEDFFFFFSPVCVHSLSSDFLTSQPTVSL